MNYTAIKLIFSFIFILYTKCYICSQSVENVDFKNSYVNLYINPYSEEVTGTVIYTFDVMAPIDTIVIDARNMKFSEIKINKQKAIYRYDEKKLYIALNASSQKGNTLTISYVSQPQKAMYFWGWNEPSGKKQVWTQGQGKNNSHWVPSFEDVNEKVIFRQSITFHKDYEVFANGILDSVSVKNDFKTWHYNMNAPMSSYLLAIAIGEYAYDTYYTERGVPIQVAYYPEDSLKVEPTYRYTREMLHFMEEETGVYYPWEVYRQVPVKDFLYAGMENTTTTIFSDSYMVDSIAFNDRNYVNVNAHEMAHQWFGNLVTARDGEHHWLQEGFATYYALQAEKMLFGEEYYHNKLHQSAQKLITLSKEGIGESLLNPNAGSLTFYEKGAWVLHMLRNKIGDKAFKAAVKAYLTKYQFSSATTDDFLKEAERASGTSLTHFKQTWLENDRIPVIKASWDSGNLKITENNDHISLRYCYSVKNDTTCISITKNNLAFPKDVKKESRSSPGVLNPENDKLADVTFSVPQSQLPKLIKGNYTFVDRLKALERLENNNAFEVYRSLLQSDVYYPLKQQILYRIAQLPLDEKLSLYEIALQTTDPKVQKVIAMQMDTIPPDFKKAFTSLLKASSYDTREAALLKLWVTFPEERIEILKVTKEETGHNDKNIRILWITLTLLTPSYLSNETPALFDELQRYTFPSSHFEVRQNAFQVFFQLDAFTDPVLRNLINACVHPVWQFSKNASQMLNSLLKDPVYKERLLQLAPSLRSKERAFLEARLNALE
ncbi:M1 family metallopeptidase [Ascidiimonas aurantiaca]|uniref:M1 family metallopeptidase n=1 Tax=Ascidiimonas aurantiaca TaxID=1685432 RepID=UPI0030EF5997